MRKKWIKLTQSEKCANMAALKVLFQENVKLDLKNDSAIGEKQNPIGVDSTIDMSMINFEG